jgi:hypothetical protein
MKENTHFTILTFFIPFMYVTVVGLFFHDSLPFSKVMDRHQTDELKGFMQIVILLYRMSAAQNKIPLFLIIRLFTSSYLFISGYGHFMYYWNTSNFSITRFFEILFRINFIPIVLCFSMNRMYQFYSFIPLVTFWYVCTYLIMIIYPRVSAKTAKDNPLAYFYMLIKLGLLVGFSATLNLSESTFEKIFIARPWKFLFVSSDDLINDWKSRWSNDSYVFIWGMFFGLVICVLKRINIIDDYDGSQIIEPSTSREKWRNNDKCISVKLKLVLILFSLIGLISYFSFALLCTSQENCNHVTPYITFIPIISYFVLRNTINCLKDKCSFMFSWVGRISLELYICSFHIWLAADSNGILVLLPRYPVLNMLITTFIFICISHELNSITKLVSQYVVPNNWRTCLRNFCSFLILLTPIAIKYGYI